MKVFVAASIALFGTVTVSSAAEPSNSSGGFGYVAVGSGQCQVLVDAKSAKPIFQTSKTGPAKVVMIGSKADCPADFNDYKVNRFASGFVDSYVYHGVLDNGRKVFIVRKFGSDFTFRYGPEPKKPAAQK